MRLRPGSVHIPCVIGVGSGGSMIAATLGLGRAPGKRAVRRPRDMGERLVEPVVVSSSRMDVEDLMKEGVRYGFVIGSGKGSGSNPEKGRMDYLHSSLRDEILEAPKRIAERRGMRLDLIPVICCLGFGCGSGAGPEIIKDLRDRYRDSLVMGFGILPFSWEGPDTYRRAVKAIKRMMKYAPTIPISNHYVQILVSGTRHRKLKDLINRINEYIASWLEVLVRGGMTSETITRFDVSDMISAFKPGPILMLRWRLRRPDQLASLEISDSSTLIPIRRGDIPSKLRSALTVILSGVGAEISEDMMTGFHESLESALNARIRSSKLLIGMWRGQVGVDVLTMLAGVRFNA